MADNDSADQWGPPPASGTTPGDPASTTPPPTGPTPPPTTIPTTLPTTPPSAGQGVSVAGPPTLPASSPPTLPPIGPPSASQSGPGAAPPMVGAPMSPGAPPELSFDQNETPKRRRSKAAVAGVAAGVLAVGAAGVFAVGQFAGETDGGAATPEEVGTEMMAALEAEDMLGVVDLLLPGEREVFREPLIDLVAELTRLEILSEEASLVDLSGLDIEMTDELTTVEPTNVADISNITMTGSITASLDGDQLPIGDFITDLAGDDFDPSEFDEPPTTEEFDIPMTVVEDGGRWYLSLFHTVAEAGRAEAGEPIPPVGLEPRGGTTPEGAIDVLLDGVEQLDLGKIIAGINPNEAAALQRYAPLFLSDADQVAAEIPLDWQVTKKEYSVDGEGSTRFVTIETLRIDGTVDGETFSIEVDGDCAILEAAGERIDTCELAEQQQGDVQSDLEDLFNVSIDVTEFTEAVENAFADYEAPGITVKEVDGAWFVSPIGSGFDQLLGFLGALDRDELDQLVDAGTGLFDQAVAEFDDLSSGPLLGDEVPGTDPTTDFEDFEAEQAIAEACNELGAIEEVAECYRAAVAAGDLPDYYFTTELEYLECGLGPITVGLEPAFSLSDSEYTALVENAATCFGELIASGEVNEFEVDRQYLRPECAEGQNPYSSLDDGLFDRWLDCLYS